MDHVPVTIALRVSSNSPRVLAQKSLEEASILKRLACSGRDRSPVHRWLTKWLRPSKAPGVSTQGTYEGGGGGRAGTGEGGGGGLGGGEGAGGISG